MVKQALSQQVEADKASGLLFAKINTIVSFQSLTSCNV